MPVVERVMVDPRGAVHYALADDGTLVYTSGVGTSTLLRKSVCISESRLATQDF